MSSAPNSPDPSWSKGATDYFLAHARSPQVHFYGDEEWQTLRELCQQMSDAPHANKTLKAMMAAGKTLGTTLGDRQRLGWDVEDAPPGPKLFVVDGGDDAKEGDQ